MMVSHNKQILPHRAHQSLCQRRVRAITKRE
jgi:hypothetical protein